MNFVTLHPLKDRLRDRAFGDREALPYYVVTTATTTLVLALGIAHEGSRWDIVLGITTTALTIAGILYCFLKNGGRTGYDFIQKSIVLGWVIGVRLVLLFSLPAVALGLIKVYLGQSRRTTSWLEVLLTAIFLIVYFQRLGRHLSDTNKKLDEPGTKLQAENVNRSPEVRVAPSPQKGQAMDEQTEREILEELRRQTTMFKMVNRANIVAMAVIGFFVFLFLGGVMILLHPAPSKEPVAPKTTDSWAQARDTWEQGNTYEARGMVERLIAKHPDYYYGYSLLGSFFLELGDLTQAESNYKKAYELLPTESNQKTLAAVRKAMEKKVTSADRESQGAGVPRPKPR